MAWGIRGKFVIEAGRWPQAVNVAVAVGKIQVRVILRQFILLLCAAVEFTQKN